MIKYGLTLQHLVNRIKIDTEFMEKYPNERKRFEKRIQTSKDLIVKTVMQNDGKDVLCRINYWGE